MTLRIALKKSVHLATLQTQLAAFETLFSYPLAGTNDCFTINHGEDYSLFFRRIGSAHFVVAQDFGKAGEIVGILAAIEKPIIFSEKRRNGLYICDFKVHPEYRSTGIAQRIYRRYMLYAFCGAALRQHLTCFVAMQGDNGDFYYKAKVKPLWGGFTPVAEIAIYFADPAELKSLNDTGCREIEQPYLSLTVDNVMDRPVNLGGIKDIVITGCQHAMKIQHLANKPCFGQSFIKHLIAASEHIGNNEKICFALDVNREQMLGYLNKAGLLPSGHALVYVPQIQHNRIKDCTVFIGTHEI